MFVKANLAGSGVYAPDGRIRITTVSGTSFTGLYAADGSLNVVMDAPNVYGAYHPCGALNGVSGSYSQIRTYAPNGGLYIFGAGAAGEMFATYVADGKTSVAIAKVLDNTLLIHDLVTPANNYNGPLYSTETGLFNKLSFTAAGTRYLPETDGTWTAVGNNIPVIANMSYGRAFLVDSATTNLITTNPAAPATQDCTVAATANTLSFTGTGTITLSGASTAGPLVGTGATNRVQLTFTPTAGTLTLTITGDVRFAKLEARATASRYSEGTSVAEVATLAGSLFNLTQSAGTMYVRSAWDGGTAIASGGRIALAVDDGTASERHLIYNGSGLGQAITVDGGVTQAFQFDLAIANNVLAKHSWAFAAADFSLVQNGRTPKTGASGTLPTTTTLRIGNTAAGTGGLFGGITEFAYFGSRLSGAQQQALTA